MDDATNFGKGIAFLLALAFLVLLGLWCATASAQSVELTVAPTTAVGKATPTVTLAVTGAGTRVVTCTAASTDANWSGTKQPGATTLPEISATTTYGVTCSAPAIAGQTTAALTWVAPTTHTDGSPLTPAADLTGYEINFGASATSLPNVRQHSFPQSTTATVTGLTAGSTYFFCVKAVGRTLTSACSNSASRTLAAAVPAWTQSRSVTVTITAPPAPSAPSNLVVTEVTAFAIDENDDGTLRATHVELVPLSTSCVEDRCTVQTRRAQ